MLVPLKVFGPLSDQVPLPLLRIVVPVPVETWVALLLTGPAVHWIFNLVLMLLGVKKRAA